MTEQTTDYVPLLCRIFGHRMYEDIYPYGRLPAPVCGRRKCNHTTPGQEWRVRRLVTNDAEQPVRFELWDKDGNVLATSDEHGHLWLDAGSYWYGVSTDLKKAVFIEVSDD